VDLRGLAYNPAMPSRSRGLRRAAWILVPCTVLFLSALALSWQSLPPAYYHWRLRGDPDLFARFCRS